MSREYEALDLRKAFPPMPDACRQALMNAANSVSERKPVRRAPLRIVLVAAVLLLLTAAIAFAAQQFGWVDYFGRNYDIAVPDAAVMELEDTAPRRYQVGPMTFTFQQLLTDGRIVLSAASITTADGSEALCVGDMDAYDTVDMISGTIRDKYHLEPETAWFSAAQQLELPLYGVRALAELDERYASGGAMEDYLWDENGVITYFNMPMVNPDTVSDSLPVTLYMSVTQFDPATGEALESWTARENATVLVSGRIAEKTYLPQGNGALTLPESEECSFTDDGTEVWTVIPPIDMTLQSVHAELYPTGVYLSAIFTMPDGMDASGARDALYRVYFLDENGVELPQGINLSGAATTSELPTASVERMSSLSALPDSIIIAGGEEPIVVR